MADRQYEVAREVLLGFLKKGQSFSGSDIETAVVDAGGILRTSFGISLGQYLDGLVEQGVLRYNNKTDTYSPGKETEIKKGIGDLEFIQQFAQRLSLF
ncbi:MAG: hypothetical protein KGH55_02335 [Nanoarchaeota archaeon]|nr:hypothetical protein [Nanoarchaeota archaeon]